MSEEKSYRCDICGHIISNERNMVKLQAEWINLSITSNANKPVHCTETYHVHNDKENLCMIKLWSMLEKDKK